MQSDIFRFVALRQPETAPPGDDDVIEAAPESAPSQLVRSLEEARRSESPAASLVAAASRHRESARFAKSLAEAAPGLAALERRIADAGGRVDPGSVREVVEGLGLSADELAALHERLSDSLLASLISPPPGAETRATLERGIRALAVLRHAVQAPDAGADALARLYARPLAIPETVFPLPSKSAKVDARAAAGYDAQQKSQAALQKRVQELAARIENNEAAAQELVNAYRDDSLSRQLAAEREAPPPARMERTATGAPADEPAARARVGRFVPTLSADIAQRLSDTTKQRLAAIGRAPDALNVPEAVSRLDRDTARAADELYRGGAFGNAVRVGGTFVHVSDVADLATIDPIRWPSRIPGLCAPGDPEPPAVGEASVPSGVGKFQSLGVADLLVVRQQLLRYELGEIAHVENVMAKESRRRVHRTLDRREEYRLQEVERVEESEKDLQSTERFELQNESERTIQENASFQAGVTVTASYGPSVEVTANAAFSSDTAKSQSDRVATSHAREITERTVQRVQERVRELRTSLTVSETEETNEHGFQNDTGTHVVGVYRWLDKIYQAQVFDYGKREMLEFVVPEPAAFLRYAAANKPPEGVTIERPDPPGYCVSQSSTFIPLEPKDITRASYPFWTARYKVQKVPPPPPRFQIIATAFDQPWITDDPKAIATSNKELKVPTGYLARRAWSASNHAHYASDVSDTRSPQLDIYVGRHLLSGDGATELNGETDVVPIAIIGVLLLVYAATIEVECELADEAFAQWQLLVYTAVIGAYDEQRAAYEQQLRSAQDSAADVTVEGRNPAQNRTVERTELKKAVIAQMTGQHFDLFDAMRRRVMPYGFPQADVNEAFAEGEYIRFVEQAFEWENMLYLFYPYFWGRKDSWPLVSQLDDPDPIYAEFLKAGAARVNVPIRPGFESAVNTFLSTGFLPWKSDPNATITKREPFLSIAQEMKDQQGAVHTKSGGTVSIDHGATTLSGVGTAFDDDDVRREITIAGDVYRVKSVASTTELTLTHEYRGQNAVEVGYAIGAKAVGEPWTLRLPTSLVMLQEDHTLPEFMIPD